MSGRPARGTSGSLPPPEELVDEIGRDLATPVSPEAERLAGRMRERFGESLVGVLLYGSCLRRRDLTDGVVDLYALVDSYGSAYDDRAPRIWNRVLAPNVFYLEDTEHDPTLRSKYAVMSLSHFERGCSSWFHSYLWARFAQPARLVWARDSEATRRIRRAAATAVMRFLAEAAPLVEEGEFDAGTLWSTGLSRSYAAELRAERRRAEHLVEENRTGFERRTSRAAPGIPGLVPREEGRYRWEGGGPVSRRRARLSWAVRRWQGRVLSILRLVKAAFTFEGGIDYLAWKVERHTGESVEVTAAQRRHPVIHGLRILIRLLRRGVVR